MLEEAEAILEGSTGTVRGNARAVKSARATLRKYLTMMPKQRGVGSGDVSVSVLLAGAAEVRVVLPEGGVARVFGVAHAGSEEEQASLRTLARRWNIRRLEGMRLVGTPFDQAVQSLLIGIAGAINYVREKEGYRGPEFMVQSTPRTATTAQGLSASYAIVATDSPVGVSRGSTHTETLSPGDRHMGVRGTAEPDGGHRSRPGYFLCEVLRVLSEDAALHPTQVSHLPHRLRYPDGLKIQGVLACSIYRILVVGGQNQAAVAVMRSLMLRQAPAAGEPEEDPPDHGGHPVVFVDPLAAGRDAIRMATELGQHRPEIQCQDPVLLSMDLGFMAGGGDMHAAFPSVLGLRHAMALAGEAVADISSVPGFGQVGS